jgi:hypothetical protein
LFTVHDDPFRPQPRLDRDADGGMTTSVGRIRDDPALENGIKYVLVSHNTKMGAAKGAGGGISRDDSVSLACPRPLAGPELDHVSRNWRHGHERPGKLHVGHQGLRPTGMIPPCRRS